MGLGAAGHGGRPVTPKGPHEAVKGRPSRGARPPGERRSAHTRKSEMCANTPLQGRTRPNAQVKGAEKRKQNAHLVAWGALPALARARGVPADVE